MRNTKMKINIILHEIIDCPAEDWTCSYYKNGACCMKEIEGCEPFKECDAFYDEEEEEW